MQIKFDFFLEQFLVSAPRELVKNISKFCHKLKNSIFFQMPESKSPFLSSSTGSTRTNARSSSSMASSSGRRGAGSGSAGSSSTASGQIPPMLPSDPPGIVHAFNGYQSWLYDKLISELGDTFWMI